MQNDEQHRLVVLAQSGDEYAISRLYDDHSQGIFRFLYYRLGDLHVAEDITSEVFIQMIQSLSRFNSESGNFTSWLYTIARNKAIDFFRKNRAHSTLPLSDDIAGTQQNPEEISGNKQLTKDLKNKLQELPEEHRDLLVLRFISQLSIKETALSLGKTEDGVKGMQYRALSALREKMDSWRSK
jgi:RNA polymerase sigma-70 factor (ECF subfamily)